MPFVKAESQKLCKKSIKFASDRKNADISHNVRNSIFRNHIRFFKKKLAFCKICGILYDITQTYGVTVAQVILVHFVEVRILVGLPFFLSFFAVMAASNPFKKRKLRAGKCNFPSGVFIFEKSFFAAPKTGLLSVWRLPCASRLTGCDARARRAAPSVESLQVFHFLCLFLVTAVDFHTNFSTPICKISKSVIF